MVHTGNHGEYQWLVSPQIWLLPGLVQRHHEGLYLCIAAFDSGPIKPSDDEIAQGWRLQGSILISPPLHATLYIPHAENDEWYLFSQPDMPEAVSEIFVRYGGFTLVAPEDTYKTYDPTWEKHGLEWLGPLQEQFWEQIERLNLETYVAMGENDIVVSRHQPFMDAVHKAALLGR
jgi:hypothetical protein